MTEKTRMTSEERRQAILEAAVALFSERGFKGTTTRALARAVGVTEPVLYAHFRSKQELYRAIIETKAREGLEGLSRALQGHSSLSDREVLCLIAEGMLERHWNDPAYARLMLFIALEGGELAAMFYDFQIRGAREQLAEYFDSRIAAGAFRAMDPVNAARIFLSMVAHQGILSVLFAENLAPSMRRALVEQMVDVFLTGVLTKEG